VARRSVKEDDETITARSRWSRGGGLDVNAVVSYNLRWIRERQGWTQEALAKHLGHLTGHELPQASISAMERGFDGNRRRRFDAHELYLFSVVFAVPIAFFFLPPPEAMNDNLADTDRPVAELYSALLGHDWELELVDERLEQIKLANPDNSHKPLASVFGGDWSEANWHEHFRTWRKKRLNVLARQYGDSLDDVADFLAEFAAQIKDVGPKAYLQMKAHKQGEDVLLADEAEE
jgi:transcriptional regulator with XRE-family HTH domain